MIGLLGGTFDPPHNGHVELARAALKAVPLDRLVVLVAEQPGHRTVVADAETATGRSAREPTPHK